MRARTLLLLTLAATAALAGCERTSVTGPEAPAAPRFDGEGGSTGNSPGGYLGSGNRNDSTKTGGGG